MTSDCRRRGRCCHVGHSGAAPRVIYTAKRVRAAIQANAGLASLDPKPKAKKPKVRRRKPNGGGLLPPKPKRKPHVVEKSFVWDELQRVLRSNSAHGVTRVVYEPAILPVSGQDMRRRIHALGFSLTQFAVRHGLGVSRFYDWSHWPAGTLPLWVVRMIEFEEQMVLIADILEDESLTGEQIRAKLGAALDEQIGRL